MFRIDRFSLALIHLRRPSGKTVRIAGGAGFSGLVKLGDFRGTGGGQAAERLGFMGLDFAIDELFATGWSALDSTGCEHTADGRMYPNVLRVQQEFSHAGYELSIRYVQLFDCHRAEWRDAAGAAVGAVVGQSESEAAVYALSQMRRQTARVGA